MPAVSQGQNLVPNAEFTGDAGSNLAIGTGVVIAPSGVPDFWRAFAVNGDIDLEILPLAADEIAPGIPATNAALLRVNAFGADQGFDDDNGRMPILPGTEYHAEFWVRSGNADGSEQAFNFGFPIFAGPPEAPGAYLGREPGRLLDQVATDEWQLFVAPTFQDAEAGNGHISWRAIDDGGENAIVIALPQMTLDSKGTPPPSNLQCTRSVADVELTWQNNGVYDAVSILRNGELLEELPGDATSYADPGIPEGEYDYEVIAIAPDLLAGPTCHVSFTRVDPGTSVSDDLGEIDFEDGLTNTQTNEGSDGENEFVICGTDDVREARSNWAADDPVFDNPDSQFYFSVTDLALKSQETFLLTATVYDDPNLIGIGLSLQYTNKSSTGPGDIPNTFFPLADPPTEVLTGSGEWVDLSWNIENAGFRNFQQGSSDFRLGVTGGARICMDRVELVFLPFPVNVTCHRAAEGVLVTWDQGSEVDSVKILRDDEEIATLPGDAVSFTDTDVEDGEHSYEVVAIANAIEASGGCQINVQTVEPGTEVSVDLGELDFIDGLLNTQTQDGTDGENEFVICGPDEDIREARSNFGNDDPTPDNGDSLFYFVVTDPAMKSQSAFQLQMTVFDDPALTGTGLFLQYTNSSSTGPGDIPNTFFPLEDPPTVLLEGSGDWVVLTWEIEDAGFRSFQQGDSDFRVGVTDGARVCVDQVALVFGVEPPAGDGFLRGDADASNAINITDGIFILNFLFLGGIDPPCKEAADADNSDAINITDGIYVLNFLFLGGPPPPAPHPACALPLPDDTADLGCETPQCAI